jgi:nicotinamidase-related amidase
MKKVALLIIDAQYDFCNPKGSLFVDGAVEDNERLSQWILDNKDEIDYIGCTLDSHSLNDIAHPGYWLDKDGNHPNPMTVITVADVENGTWTAIKPQTGLQYLRDLEADGQFPHVIWPEHCLIGSPGYALDEKVLNAVNAWSRGGTNVHYVAKGVNPDTEHFGAFEAQVPIADKPETQYNFGLQRLLEKFDVVYLTGQAKSHCVANTLKQVVQKAPNLAKKFVVLEDTMSNVPGGPDPSNPSLTFGDLAQPIYDEAAKLGVKFSTTSAENLVARSGAATATA